MRKLLVAGGLALLLAFSSLLGQHLYRNRPFNPENTQVVYASPGGEIFKFIEAYGDLEESGGYLKINGLCASACTYFLNIVSPDRVCATPHSTFGFHGIYRSILGLGAEFDQGMTQTIHPVVYPKYVLDLLKLKGFDGSVDVNKEAHPSGMIWLTPKELNIKEC